MLLPNMLGVQDAPADPYNPTFNVMDQTGGVNCNLAQSLSAILSFQGAMDPCLGAFARVNETMVRDVQGPCSRCLDESCSGRPAYGHRGSAPIGVAGA